MLKQIPKLEENCNNRREGNLFTAYLHTCQYVLSLRKGACYESIRDYQVIEEKQM